MSSLTIRKKSLNTWVHNDSEFNDFIISKFYFNSFYNEFQIVEEGNTRLNKYTIGNITLYDDTDGGTPETFSTITELSLRLEELLYPAFDRTGMTIFPTMEQITNVNVTDIEDGQVLVWDASTNKWINTTIGGLATPSLSEVLMVGNRELKECIDLENSAYTFIAEDKSKYCYSISNSEFILDLANFNNGDEIVLNNSNGSDFTINSADGLNIVVGSSLVDTVTLPDGYTGCFKNFEGTSWIFTKTTGMDITPPSTEPIVVSSNVTATLNREHNVIANATITDPTPTEGMGYYVNVINGVATVGGVAYSVGTKLFRHYHSGSWRTFVYQNASTLSKIVIKDTVSSSAVTGSTLNTLAKTYEILGGVFDTNDAFNLEINAEKTGVAGISTIRAYVNTVNDFSTATIISTTPSASASIRDIPVSRLRANFKGTNLKIVAPASGLLSDLNQGFNSPRTEVALNPANTFYVFVAIQNANSGDSTVIDNVHLTT